MRGKILLTLKKPQSAKQVRVVLRAQRTVKKTVYRNGRHESQSTTEILYQNEKGLDGEMEYPAGSREYSFEFTIPNPLPYAQMGKVTSLLSGTGKPEWYVDASLDIPKGFDVSKKVKITVG